MTAGPRCSCSFCPGSRRPTPAPEPGLMWHLNARPNSDAGQGHIAGASLAGLPVSKQESSLSIQPDPDLAVSCPGAGKFSWPAASPCSFICSFSQSVHHSVSVKCLLRARCRSGSSEAIREPNALAPPPPSPPSRGLQWKLHSATQPLCEAFLLREATSPGWSRLPHAFSLLKKGNMVARLSLGSPLQPVFFLSCRQH